MSNPTALARESIDQGDYRKAISQLQWARAQLDFGDEEEVGAFFSALEVLSTEATGSQQDEARAMLDEGRQRLAQADAVRAQPRPQRLPVSTAPFIVGFELTEHVGEVVGVAVRSRGMLPTAGAELKSVVGGELKAMSNQLMQARLEARSRMVAEATRLGADAVISMRFDVEAIGRTWSGVCAYGTAVRVRRVSGERDDGAVEA